MRALRRGLITIAAAVVGAAAAVAAVTVATGGAASTAGNEAFVAAANLPPLLTLPGEPVTLRYAIVCAPADDGAVAAGAPCDGGGDVFVRAGHSGPYTKLPLQRGADTVNGRYFVDLPGSIAGDVDGFSYYAVLRDEATGRTTTLPAAGADAPQNSYPLRKPVSVALGPHRFGATRPADARVVSAPWGDGPAEVGLSGGVTDARVGPSAFDVAPDGTVTLLDEMNGRIVRWRHGVPAPLHVDVPPAPDDMSLGADGSIYVADGVSAPGRTPLLRTFAPDGEVRALDDLPERTWSQLRVGPEGPVVQEHPSEQWMPRGGPARGRSGRPLPDGSRLIVLRSGAGEIRAARIVNGSVHESWRIVSDTPLGEIQLADRLGNRLVLVVKAYTEDRDEYDVLVLDGQGIVRRFSLPSAAWAETAPLARFRLVGATLYQLGATPSGAFIDRYDLGGGA